MDLEAFFQSHADIVQVRLTRVRGSSPRNEGTEMFVAPGGVHGTIGGGQLEYMAIENARQLLRSGEETRAMDVPLGPDIGQCCGGRVELSLSRMQTADLDAALRAAREIKAAQPHVYVIGAGHVGRALAHFFQALPVQCILTDSRAEELALSDAQVEKRLQAVPEAEVRGAPPGSAFVILTHDHALDYLLTAEALRRGDAAYVGLIGSATKRARFESFCAETEPHLNTAALICPIGAFGSGDKRPEVIASFVVAEVLTRLTPVRARQEELGRRQFSQP